jgi:hypothetical protein
MAGTLTISTLSDGTNSTSATNCIQGSAKAWVSVNGTGPAINASYNVSSVTRPSTGLYTINFTNALPNANYSAVASALGGSASVWAFIGYAAATTTSCQVATVFKNLLSDAPSLFDGSVNVTINSN